MKTSLGLAMLIVLVSCGDSTTPALSRTEYIAQANSICELVNSQTERITADIADQVPEQPTTEEAGTALLASLEMSTPIFEAGLADLRALPPPSDDAELLAGLYDALEEARSDVIIVAAAYATGEVEAAEFLAGPDQPFIEVNAALRAYGLTECG